MNVLIASDIHGDAVCCRRMLDMADRLKADRLLLLGDLLYHGPRNPIPAGYNPGEVISLLSARQDRLICVRGNCDSEVDQMVLPFPILQESAVLFLSNRLWFAAHGHRAGANPSLGDLPPLPAGSIFLSGHTHIPVLSCTEKDILLINPGSVSLSKSGPCSFALFEEAASSGKPGGTISIRDMQGQILQDMTLRPFP